MVAAFQGAIYTVSVEKVNRSSSDVLISEVATNEGSGLCISYFLLLIGLVRRAIRCWYLVKGLYLKTRYPLVVHIICLDKRGGKSFNRLSILAR